MEPKFFTRWDAAIWVAIAAMSSSAMPELAVVTRNSALYSSITVVFRLRAVSIFALLVESAISTLSFCALLQAFRTKMPKRAVEIILFMRHVLIWKHNEPAYRQAGTTNHEESNVVFFV